MNPSQTKIKTDGSRLPLVRKLLKECFRGDPLLSAEEILARYLLMTESQKGRSNRRLRLVTANLAGRYDLVPELQWRVGTSDVRK